MAEISANPGLKVSELAERLALHVSTASNMPKRLEGLGLAKRARVGGDQRTVLKMRGQVPSCSLSRGRFR